MIVKAILETLFAYVATICFGVITNIPRRAFNVAGIIGGLSWLVYWGLYYHLHLGLAVSNMLAAILIAILSMVAARHQKMPTIIYTVPSLVTFVPGGQAYRMVRNFVVGNNSQSLIFLYQVMVIAGAITLGLGVGEMINRLVYGPKKQGSRRH
ncbi:MAG TPA: threonine/serine exporter family protein [Candidatus Limosilactobacillus merdipullorum]|uniref:Threonine/serine exporter family protein n=1 Tax=Candidatus Limosilactobacillus merdipullorum TaxID=2838653 RepID=A0A9D1QMN7_9LACO|nr:threonine/serine exporter family protein [Candidatus Limosilactobacillus merdipullorum]